MKLPEDVHIWRFYLNMRLQISYMLYRVYDYSEKLNNLLNACVVLCVLFVYVMFVVIFANMYMYEISKHLPQNCISFLTRQL